MIYRRYYGWRLMWRMLAVFWALMSTAALITEGIFTAAGLVPTVRPTEVAPAHFSWNYTTYLNIIFLVLFGVLYWLYRNRERLGAGHGYARDPMCGMQVETANAVASVVHDGKRVYFCSDHCKGRFLSEPERYTEPQNEPAHYERHQAEHAQAQEGHPR
jgi:YHS domain-containing protein